LKRICPSCGTRYYDFNKRPVHCPECKTEFTGEIKMKARRSRAAVIEDDEAILGDEGLEVKEVAANDDDVELPENDDTVSLDDVEEEVVEEEEETLAIETLDDDFDDDLDDDDDDDDDDEEEDEEE
jgi:uncharacterized protein (TIGR02300 family)